MTVSAISGGSGDPKQSFSIFFSVLMQLQEKKYIFFLIWGEWHIVIYATLRENYSLMVSKVSSAMVVGNPV